MASLTPVDDVIDYLLEQAQCLSKIETISLNDALGRTLSADIVSQINVPGFDNSAMDGYALNVEDLGDSVEQNTFSVSGRIAAGTMGEPLERGSVARIFTGAPIPKGANAVIMQEETEQDGDKVCLKVMPKPGDNLRLAGQDIKVGQIILSKGLRLRPQDLGLIASVGYGQVEVYSRLRVAVMSTGDELIEPVAGAKLAPGQIFNSNHYTLQGLIRGLGMLPVDIGLVGDSPEATEAALTEASEKADCIVSSGGVSVGEEDHVKAAVTKLGRLDLWRLAIKPGKPLAFGAIGATPFFGLPGNPVSSFVTFVMIARPFLLKSQGAENYHLRTVYASSQFEVKGGTRREYYRVQMKAGDKGGNEIVNFTNQGSGIMSSLSWANALAEIEIGQNVAVGDPVKIHLFD